MQRRLAFLLAWFAENASDRGRMLGFPD